MSEYQYYEFQAIDRPLTEKEMEELGELSTRAEITSTSFTNEYNYGNFRGKVDEVLAKYFDAHLYVANWGTHRLMFRLPAELVDVEAMMPYCDGDTVSLSEKGPSVLLGLCSNPEGGGEWEEGGGYLAPLLPLRADILAGDLRALYLGWLAYIQEGYFDEDEENEPEPPVPPGLGQLSAPLTSLAEFLRIEDDLIDAAAEGSAPGGPSGPSKDELSAWIAEVPLMQKNAWLLALAENEVPSPRYELLRQFREAWKAKQPAAPAAEGARRTIAELLAARDDYAQNRKKREAEARQRKAQREAQQAAEARARHLDGLMGQEAKLWAGVEPAIDTKLPKKYDEAVSALVDLRDLAARTGTLDAFRAQLAQLRERHRNKRTLLNRLDNNNLK